MNEYIIYILLFLIMVEIHRVGTMMKAFIIAIGTLADITKFDIENKK